MAAPRDVKVYEEYAWILLLLPNIAFVFTSWLFAPNSEATVGQTWDQIAASNPGLRDYVGGLFSAVAGFAVLSAVLGIAVAAVSYRKGERWAWYVYWALPAVLLLFLAIDLTYGRGGGEWQAAAVLIVISLAGLLLPFRKFFPRKVTTIPRA